MSQVIITTIAVVENREDMAMDLLGRGYTANMHCIFQHAEIWTMPDLIMSLLEFSTYQERVFIISRLLLAVSTVPTRYYPACAAPTELLEEIDANGFITAEILVDVPWVYLSDQALTIVVQYVDIPDEIVTHIVNHDSKSETRMEGRAGSLIPLINYVIRPLIIYAERVQFTRADYTAIVSRIAGEYSNSQRHYIAMLANAETSILGALDFLNMSTQNRMPAISIARLWAASSDLDKIPDHPYNGMLYVCD